MRFYGGAFYRSWADNASPSTLNPPNTDAPTDQDMATARVDVNNSGSPGLTIWSDAPIDLCGAVPSAGRPATVSSLTSLRAVERHGARPAEAPSTARAIVPAVPLR